MIPLVSPTSGIPRSWAANDDKPGVNLLANLSERSISGISRQVLERAAHGIYPRGCLKELPRAWIAEAFDDRGGDLRIRPRFRSGVTFVRQDIRNEYPHGPFDLILCRNLALTYFDPALQRSVLERLAARLRVDGYLVIGKHESLPATMPGFSVSDRRLPIYQRAAQTVPKSV